MKIEKLGNITLVHGDCMEYMDGIEENEFDLAIVDPPFNINAGKKKIYHKNSFTKYIPKEWDNERPSKCYFDKLFQISNNQIIWGANYFVDMIPISKNWIVWDKLQPDGVSFSMFELAYYSGSGQAKIYRGYNGANRCVNEKIAKQKGYIRFHPTQKHVALYKWLLTNYGKPGMRILDTHGGSMSHAIAAHDLGFDLTIIEKDDFYYEEAKKRLIEHQKQLTLW